MSGFSETGLDTCVFRCSMHVALNSKLGRMVVSSVREPKQVVIGQLRSIQRSAGRVRGYFLNETTRYAAS